MQTVVYSMLGSGMERVIGGDGRSAGGNELLGQTGKYGWLILNT